MNNNLPAKITRQIDDAIRAMHQHPDHLLLPIYRREIYNALDEVSVSASAAHLVKVWLGILTVRRVLSYWQPIDHSEEDEYNYIPQHMLEMTEGMLNGIVPKTTLKEKVEHWFEMSATTGELSESPYYNNWCVFDAGLATARLAIEPRFWQTAKIDRDTTDDDLHHQDGDTARWACTAYAGGEWTPSQRNNPHRESYGSWNRNTPEASGKRKEFWEWWLLQVVSDSWQKVR
jgi:immunity protein Imm5 of predicted polymorphic toxin system